MIEKSAALRGGLFFVQSRSAPPRTLPMTETVTGFRLPIPSLISTTIPQIFLYFFLFLHQNISFLSHAYSVHSSSSLIGTGSSLLHRKYGEAML